MIADIVRAVYRIEELSTDVPITNTQVAILAYLATYADKDGKNIRPGIDLIIKHTRFKRRTVIKSLDALEKAGLLIPDGRVQRTQRYTLALDKLPLERPILTKGTPPTAPINGNNNPLVYAPSGQFHPRDPRSREAKETQKRLANIYTGREPTEEEREERIRKLEEQKAILAARYSKEPV